MPEPIDLDAHRARLLADLDELGVAIREFMEAVEAVATSALELDENLEAERITKSGETHDELVRRLLREGRK